MNPAKKFKTETVEYARCSVYFCHNSYAKTMHTKPSVVYFPFPNDEYYYEEWKQFCVQDDPLHSYNFICSEHFSDSEFSYDSHRNRKLKSTAIPSKKLSVKAEEVLCDSNNEYNMENYEYQTYEEAELSDQEFIEEDNEDGEASVPKEDEEEDEGEEENGLDSFTGEVLQRAFGEDEPLLFESEKTNDAGLKRRMVYQEARAALKLAVCLKPPPPKKKTPAMQFANKIVEELKIIKDDKVYNNVVWAIQKELREGIEKFRKKQISNVEDECQNDNEKKSKEVLCSDDDFEDMFAEAFLSDDDPANEDPAVIEERDDDKFKIKTSNSPIEITPQHIEISDVKHDNKRNKSSATRRSTRNKFTVVHADSPESSPSPPPVIQYVDHPKISSISYSSISKNRHGSRSNRTPSPQTSTITEINITEPRNTTDPPVIQTTAPNISVPIILICPQNTSGDGKSNSQTPTSSTNPLQAFTASAGNSNQNNVAADILRVVSNLLSGGSLNSQK